MPYGTIKVDTITFTDGGVDKSVAISGLVQNPTFTGNVTVTGTVSGATIRATTVSGVTISGTTVNAASGVFTTQISGAVVVAPAGTVSAPSVQVGTGASIAPGFYGAGTDQLGVSTGGSSRLIIDSVGQIRVVTLGSAAAPALVVGNDINTGIYSPGADQIGISTNGAGRLFVDASGGIGIGTTSPNATLHVAGPARIGANDTSDAELQIGAGATGNRNAYIDLVGDTTYADYGLRLLRNNNGANGDSFLTHRGTGTLYLKCEDGGSIGFGTNNTERLRITSAGLVGIGTSSPGAALDVQGNIRLSASNPNIEFNNGGAMIYGPSANTLAFATGGGVSSPVEKARIDSSGRLLVGTSSIALGSPQAIIEKTSSDIDLFRVQCGAAESSGNIAGLSFGHGANGARPKTAIGAVATGTFGLSNLVFYVDSTADNNSVSSSDEKMRIDTSGRVGIGTASPSTTLHVAGSTTVTSQVNVAAKIGPNTDSDVLIGSINGNTPFIASQGAYPLALFTNSTERARIDSSGRLLVGTSTDSGGALLQVNGNRIRVGTAKTPASATDTGTAGEICWDANYIYVCTATNTWKRTAIATW